MAKDLLRFEWRFFQRSFGTYIIFGGFLALGFFAGLSPRLSFPEIHTNAPYIITFTLGLLSLTALFPVTLFAAQALLREQDHRFDDLLYTTPVKKVHLLVGRFLLITMLSLGCLLLLAIGYALGHLWADKTTGSFGPFSIVHYLHAFIIFIVPNVFFCAAVICGTAWLTKSKLMIYMSGLMVYVAYILMSLFSNSPLMANASPMSAEAMAIAALGDPFGLSAFFEQTRYWSVEDRNGHVASLTGHLLINRLWVMFFSAGLVGASIRMFSFRVKSNSNKKQEFAIDNAPSEKAIEPIVPQFKAVNYRLKTWFSFVCLDMKSLRKSIPFYMLVAVAAFALSMEMYANIDSGMRIPERYATTGLLVNTLLESLPLFILAAVLFFGSEWMWKSQSTRFESLEKATPASPSIFHFAKITALVVLSLVLVTLGINLGVGVQVIKGYPIHWGLYASLYWFVGAPALLCAVLVVSVHVLSGNRYVGLALSVVILVLTNSAIGQLLGLSHPLVRFAQFMPGVFSDLNGFGYYPNLFTIKMLYSLGLVGTLFSFHSIFRLGNFRKGNITFICLWLICAAMTGMYILKHTKTINQADELHWQQAYEEKYRTAYQGVAQPSVTHIQTTIDLYPNEMTYQVSGSYQLVNKTDQVIREFIVHTWQDIQMQSLRSSNLSQIKMDRAFGQYVIKPAKPLMPKDSFSLHFTFRYSVNPWNGHNPANAIVQNGSFIRLSNYFPRIGYQSELEITDESERAKRTMPAATSIKGLTDAMEQPYPYGFIRWEALVSAPAEQTVVGIGELVKRYRKNDRTYFHFDSKRPIPFRFGLSSAVYEVKKTQHDSIAIEIYYHPRHAQNVTHLMERIKQSLTYCQKHFGPYPFKIIRFAEISNFTQGFAGTAYPATIFMNEEIFHLNLDGFREQDVINQLAGHELAHQWWGTVQLAPDDRQGSRVLTETLAMYTELMLYKAAHGEEKMQEMVRLYEELYQSERGFSEDEPLYLAHPDNVNVVYNKGLLAMYELYMLMGEERINHALRNLLIKHAYPNPPPTTLDLIRELQLAVPLDQKTRIDEILKK